MLVLYNGVIWTLLTEIGGIFLPSTHMTLLYNARNSKDLSFSNHDQIKAFTNLKFTHYNVFHIQYNAAPTYWKPTGNLPETYCGCFRRFPAGFRRFPDNPSLTDHTVFCDGLKELA